MLPARLRSAVVIIKGAGEKAFCAGGDVAALAQAGMAGDIRPATTFFAEEYRLDHLIATHSKPQVALIDGVTSMPRRGQG